MKILILGHKGMLGFDLMLKLHPANELTGKDIDDFDITSPDDCRDIISESKPDCVINAAAFTNVDACETEKERSFDVNALGVKNIVEACKKRNVKIVHFSTDYVFDGTKNSPYTEKDICNPINFYGQTKREGETFLHALSQNYLVIRTSWLYGINGRNFVKTIMQKAQTEKKLEVVNDQIGSPTYTKDLAGAVKLLLEKNQTGIFHVTNRGHCSWYDFAVKILQNNNMTDVTVNPVKTEQFVRPAMRPAYSVLSNRKLHETTGKMMRPWQIALMDYLDLERFKNTITAS
ncbi:MAG: dTDP-4-dehydrorhamnose reductase [Deltaproteobacteria bacterium]|nr:dTDP-4-dehydrorhamnose reductase [Deltaproteobacteria bacterium]